MPGAGMGGDARKRATREAVAPTSRLEGGFRAVKKMLDRSVQLAVLSVRLYRELALSALSLLPSRS